MESYSNIDMKKNQILNLVLHNSTTAPTTPARGQIYYNSEQDIFYYWNGTIWVNVNSSISITGGVGIIIDSSNPLNPIVKINLDETTLTTTSDGKAMIKDSGVSANKIATNAVTTAKINAEAVTFAKIQKVPTMTVIGNITGASAVPSSITIIDSSTMVGASSSTLATSGSIKAYIDSRVSGIGQLIGGWDASSNTTFPTKTSPSTIVKSDYWYVTVEGTIGTIKLDVGDVLIANKDGASSTLASDWIILETNRDKASTTVYGYVKFATVAEVQNSTGDGVVKSSDLDQKTATETRFGFVKKATDSDVTNANNDKFITPAQVIALLNSNNGTYRANIGNGTAVSYDITHNLNSTSVLYDVFKTATNERILCDTVIKSQNIVTVSFSTAPTSNQFYIVIKK